MKKLMIFLAASCFQNMLHSMETVVASVPRTAEYQRKALQNSRETVSQVKLDDSSDELYSFFAAAKPIMVKIKSHKKGSEEHHIAYAVLLREKETGQISLKLIIIHNERSKLIYKTQFDEALDSLIRYIRGNVRMDSWDEVISFARALLRRSNDPLWQCLIIDGLYSIYRSNGFTRLMLAIELNENHRLDDWIRAYLQVSKDNPDTNVRAANTTALISCVSSKDGQGDSETDIVCQLVDVGKASVDLSNDDGSTPLMFAAMHNNTQAMRFLLKKGASINACDGKGHTALHIASANQSVDAVRLLLKNKANTEIETLDARFTPLVTAIYVSSAPIAQLLLEAGANPNVMVYEKDTALTFAISTFALRKDGFSIDKEKLPAARKIIDYLLKDVRTDCQRVVGDDNETALVIAETYDLVDVVAQIKDK